MRSIFMRHGIFAAMSFLFLFTVGAVIQANAVMLYTVSTGTQLVRFDSATPGTVTSLAINGLQGGETVLGIDFRPATGQLYAVGSTSRLYTINRTTGAATFAAALSIPLSGTAFGVDFNPTVDRLRIISNTGQNLRVNPNDGVVTNDGAINGPTTSVDGAAYTNDFNGATATTLYDISATTDTLYTQNPPNNGTLVSVGALGIDVTAVNGFDYTSVNNTAYAALTVGAVTSLYTVNTTSGAATLVGLIGTGTTGMSGLAAEIGSTGGFTAVGLTTANQLVTFNTSRPNNIQATVAITGLQAGENLLGIDFRPATGRLFGIGSTSRLYTINVNTGVATQVGTAGAFTLTGTDFGFDFNPTVDRIRIVSNTGQNLRLNPNDGTLAATDAPLNPGTPAVTAVAYTNSFAGATSTTLYDIDSTSDSLSIQNPPNNGTLVPVGPLGVNVTESNGFDIHAGSNTALAAFQLNGETTSKLFSINLATGSASFIGPVGSASALRGFALMSGSAASARTSLDYDGDGRADNAVFRLSTNTTFINRSSNNSFYSYQFGLASDIQVPGDYDGDGIADSAVWRPSNGVFYVLRSSDGAVQNYQFGLNGDEPVARDYDGDRKTDFAVVRRTGGQMIWYINLSATNTFRIDTFGLNSDITAPGDYDGDGRFDLGTFRDNGGSATFYTLRSTLGFAATQFGLGTDLVVPGDYDGDGRTDLGLVRGGSSTTWLILRSSDGGFSQTQFGIKADYTVQADYDGDGRSDVAAYRPSSGAFYRLRSSNGLVDTVIFGQNGDYPIANFDTH